MMRHKSYFFLLWHLIINLCTLKGGDDNDSMSSSGDGGLGAIGNAGGYGVGGVDDSASNPNSPGYSGEGNSEDSINPTANVNTEALANAAVEAMEAPGLNSSTEFSFDVTAGIFSDTISVTSTTANTLGGYNTSITSPGLFGYGRDDFTTDKSGQIQDHNVNTSFGFSYDKHHDLSNQEVGFVTELIADTTQLLGLNLSLEVIDTINSIESIATYSLGLLNAAKGIQLGLSLVSVNPALALGMTTTSMISITESLNSINAILGSSVSLAAANALSYGSQEGNSSLFKNSLLAAKKEEEQKRASSLQYEIDLLNGTIFDKLPGGSLYGSQFAGAMFFDAANNPSFEIGIGGDFNIKDHSYLMNIGIKDQLEKNLPGSNSFNVLRT